MEDYHCQLKTEYVKTAWEHWNKLHTDQISSVKLREMFRSTYRAYSPHKREEVFTICPWIPGPRYFSANCIKLLLLLLSKVFVHEKIHHRPPILL